MLKRFILCDYPRASWQYDVMVGIIVAFVFLTPRDWFRDQPRIPTASNIATLPSENGSSVFFVNTELLAEVPDNQWAERLTQLLRVRTGDHSMRVTRVKPVLDSEGGLQGYMAFARP